MAKCEVESTVVLTLQQEEAQALLTALAHIKDNPWTDAIHEALFDCVDTVEFTGEGELVITKK